MGPIKILLSPEFWVALPNLVINAIEGGTLAVLSGLRVEIHYWE